MICDGAATETAGMERAGGGQGQSVNAVHPPSTLTFVRPSEEPSKVALRSQPIAGAEECVFGEICAR